MIGTPRRLPSSRRDWQRILDTIGLRPSKGRGQNFLVDDETVQRILALAELTAEDSVLEIGPGLGALTGHLLRTVDHVTAIELDWPGLVWEVSVCSLPHASAAVQALTALLAERAGAV